MLEPLRNTDGESTPEVDMVLPSSELQFRSLLEKLPAGAYTCNREGLITYFNPHAARVWGREPKLYDPEDRFCGSFKLFSTDGTAITHDKCWMALALQMEREFNGHEIIVERPDGERSLVLAHANPIRDEEGNLLGAVNVLVDISDRKRAEDALREADRAKNEFLATLAHELRNPLAPVRNAVEILKLQGISPTELQWSLDVIDRQMQQMTRLIDDLLDIARITGNKLELRKERSEISQVVRSAVETSSPLIQSCGQEFVVSLPSEDVALDCDPTRLAQVIANLLNNAAKYTERGGRIWLTVERQGSDLVIDVRDTGIGIPSEMLPRIFDMFVQVGLTTHQSRGGLGLGLTLVKRLVEMHGGSILARSDGPGKGSDFEVRLPAIVTGSPPEVTVDPVAKRIPDPAALRILVVDDNQDSSASLAMLLRITGNDIRVADDGVEALAVADQFIPEVVLLDIGLPKMNGYEVARALRQRTWGNGLVLIALTGWGQAEDRERSKRAGFDHHLVKPVDPAALLRLLASLGSARPHV